MTRYAYAALLAGASLVAACGHDAPEEVETETVVPVTAQAATTGTIRAVIHATGTIEPAPGADLSVTAPEAARIADMPKAEGDAVRRGDLLVRFDIPSLRAETASKRADVDRAEARLENAKAAQARAHDLFARGVAARKEQEDADRELAESQAALREAQAALTSASALAARAEIHATFDGIVARRTHNPGDMVDPSTAEPVLRVIDPRRLEVDALIPVSDIGRIVIGAAGRLAVSPDSPPETLKVISRPAAIEPGTASAPVRLAFAAVTRLAAGTPVQVDINAEERKNVVLVPAEAIVREGAETAVFIVADGKAQRKAVELGVSDGTQTEIRSGIKAGDMVIVHGQAGLPDGTKVTTEPADKK